MTTQIGQVTYTLFPSVAVPGQLGDNTVNRIVSKVAAESINPGRAVELASDGNIQQCQQTGSTLNVYGVAILLTMREGLGQQNDSATLGGAVYSVGDVVPVLRRGSLYGEWKGTTQVEGNKPNVYHSSTTATDRGKFTDASTSTGAGTEVANAPSWIQIRAVLSGSGNVVLLDVNAPGAA